MALKDNAILKILKSTIRLPAQFTLYTSALLAIAAIPQADLPPILLPLATSIGVNSLSNILERVAKDDKSLTEVEIQNAIQEAIKNSNIKNLLIKDFQLQNEIGKLLRKQNYHLIAQNNNEIELLQRLNEQTINIKQILEDLKKEVNYVSNQIEQFRSSKNHELVRITPKIVHFKTYLKPQTTKTRVKVSNKFTDPIFTTGIKFTLSSNIINQNNVLVNAVKGHQYIEHKLGDIVTDSFIIRIDGQDTEDNEVILLLISELDPSETLTFDVHINPRTYLQKSLECKVEHIGHLNEPMNIIQSDNRLELPIKVYEDIKVKSAKLLIKLA